MRKATLALPLGDVVGGEPGSWILRLMELANNSSTYDLLTDFTSLLEEQFADADADADEAAEIIKLLSERTKRRI
jgi:hypothetical protein